LVSIDRNLIAQITRFPSKGKHPSLLFTDNTKEKALVERIKENYGTFKGARNLDVASINDDIDWFMT